MEAGGPGYAYLRAVGQLLKRADDMQAKWIRLAKFPHTVARCAERPIEREQSRLTQVSDSVNVSGQLG
jgi:hypothetical protein